jgi:hypothetical protein
MIFKEVSTMRKWWVKLTGLMVMAGLLLPELVLAAGPKAAPLVVVADTRKFTGWEAWWTNLYNESHLYFALLTVILIPIIGLLFGVLADLVMSRIGIDLKSRDLAEH